MKKTGTLLIVIALILLTNLTTIMAQENKNGVFMHTVFFWLKNPDNKIEREAFEKSLKKFIDGSVIIKTKHLGTPAITNRTVIDNTYTYCLMVTFASKDDHDKYQDDPAHKLFVKESENLWKKVLVYDSENIW